MKWRGLLAVGVGALVAAGCGVHPATAPAHAAATTVLTTAAPTTTTTTVPAPSTTVTVPPVPPGHWHLIDQYELTYRISMQLTHDTGLTVNVLCPNLTIGHKTVCQAVSDQDGATPLDVFPSIPRTMWWTPQAAFRGFALTPYQETP